MKASIRFREEQKPLFRAKIPLNVLSLPFQSGVVAGESKELSFHLSTFFDAGPIFKLAYRPNDTQNPFGFICKTGIGHLGSPISSPFTMSAEFNFVGNQNPTFFLHFKPKFGDFAIKKWHSSSVLPKKIDPKLNGSVSTDGVTVLGARYFEERGLFPKCGKISVLPVDSAATAAAAAAATSVMEIVLSGAKVKATTALHLMNRAVVSSRWGLRFPPASPADEVEDAVIVPKNEMTSGISFRRFPMLLMDKISIEHVSKEKIARDSKVGLGSNLDSSSEVAEACLNMKKQLEILQSDYSLLRRALEDRLEFATVKVIPIVGDPVETGRGGGGDRRSPETSGKGIIEGNVNGELKKPSKGN